jgi:Spy/CpxP family protein refolding chaperone
VTIKRKSLIAALAFLLPAAAFAASPASAATTLHKARHHAPVHRVSTHHHMSHKKLHHVAS